MSSPFFTDCTFQLANLVPEFQNTGYLEINVEIEYSDDSFPISKVEVSPNPIDHTINLNELIEGIKQRDDRTFFSNATVYYYSPISQAYCKITNLGSRKAYIPPHAILDTPKGKTLILKVVDFMPMAKEENSEFNVVDMSMISTDNTEVDEPCYELKKSKRAKEKTICEAIELVRKWRLWYLGKAYDPNTGEYIKKSLEEGAKLAGCAKKSLDDYLLMIKHAKNYGFDFNANKDRGFGDLREFVKKAKAMESMKPIEFDDDEEEKCKKVSKKSRQIKGRRV